MYIRFNPLHAPPSKPLGANPMSGIGGGKGGFIRSAASGIGGKLHTYLGHFAQPKFIRAGHNTSGHWIQGAIKHPGAEKKAAARAGESTHAYMEKHKNSPGKAGARARLGLRLEKMHH